MSGKMYLRNTPTALHLFEVNFECIKLDEKTTEKFHSIVAKLLFVSHRGRPDILVAIAFLTTRTSKEDQDDWKKLNRLMQYLNHTTGKVLTLSITSFNAIRWRVDASYATHNDMKSHTGAGMSMGRGLFYSKSSKQKFNSKISTEAELIGASDMTSQIIWTKMFLEATR